MGYTQANAIPITFPAGSIETVIEVPITNDRHVEGTERFLGQIISGGGITGLDIFAPTATVDISDDDSKYCNIFSFHLFLCIYYWHLLIPFLFSIIIACTMHHMTPYRFGLWI